MTDRLAWKVTKVGEFDWEPYALADGGQSDPGVGNVVYFRLGGENDAWARFFDSFDEYEVTIIG